MQVGDIIEALPEANNHYLHTREGTHWLVYEVHNLDGLEWLILGANSIENFVHYKTKKPLLKPTYSVYPRHFKVVGHISFKNGDFVPMLRPYKAAILIQEIVEKYASQTFEF